MNDIVKTTVYLPAAEYRRLKAIAEAEGRPAAELLREAVTEYARQRTLAARPRSIGALRTGDSDLSEKTDELLAGFGA
jgi:predicted DNA-binding protein